MNTSSFRGTVMSSSNQPDNCSDSLFTLKDPSKLENLSQSDVATEYWYGGRVYYDYKKGTYKEKYNKIDLTDANKALADDFTRMVWRSTSNVSFGIKGRYVYARYCSQKGNTGDKDNYIANVKKDCIKNGVDVCFEKAALDAHNEKRAKH